MARKREFQVDEALDAAVLLFWRQGYSATSVRDLCAAMDVRPGSFYAAFTNKDTCYRLALQRYLQTQLRAATAIGPDLVRGWFDAIVHPERAPTGCLLINSAVEYDQLDSATQALVSARIQSLEDTFWLCLKDRPHARQDASLLANAVIGIHVQARSGAHPDRLRAIADSALRIL